VRAGQLHQLIETMNLNHFVAVLKARWWMVAAVAAVITLLVLGINLALPPLYTAQASVLVNTRGFDPMRTIDAQTLAGSQGGLIATQIDLIRSDRVARQVVADLGLDTVPEVLAGWRLQTGGRGNVRHDLGRGLLQRLEVVPSRDSSVLQLAFTARTPDLAVKVVDAFARVYVDTGLELRVDPARDYAQWFDTRRDALRQQLEAAQARLSAYQRQNQVLPAQVGQVDVESSRLAELTARLVGMQATRSESASLRREASRSNSLADVLNSPAIATLRLEVARSEAAVRELAVQLGPRHPQLRTAEEQLQARRSQLAAEMQMAQRSVGSADNVNERRLAEAEQAVEQQRRRVLALTQSGDQITVLRRDVENAQRALDDTESRRSQAFLEASLQQTNVALLSSAALPSAPAGPRVFLNTVVGAVAALLLGVGLAVGLEVLRPLVRRREDLAELTGLPLLATVSRARRLPAQRRRLVWLVGKRGPPPTAAAGLSAKAAGA